MKRAQARVMMLFGENPRPPAAPHSTSHATARGIQWMEDWYYDGAFTDWARTSCEDLAKRFHRRLRALRSMSDEQYIQMRKRRFFSQRELEPSELNGVICSARGVEINRTRHLLASLEGRLEHVVESLPTVAGYAVDQDHFRLRGFRPTWYVDWRFSSYLSLEKRLHLFKEMRAIERGHEEIARKRIKGQRRAEKYPELVRQLRELRKRLKSASTGRGIDVCRDGAGTPLTEIDGSR